MSKSPTFKAFLSHRYKSPAANQRFFDVLSAHGNVQFEVDVGIKATNVTRLEKAVRDADGFVGIYPFPSEDDERPDAETASKASRYFRLELDLALRSRRPAIAFIDARYGAAITAPPAMRVFRYDHRELRGTDSDRNDARLSELARDFCREVAVASQLRARVATHDRVGIILPGGKRRGGAYSASQIARLEEQLAQRSLDFVHLDTKVGADARFISELETLDWAIVDIGAESCASGIPAFLHGRFLPQMRLVQTSARETRSPLETTLLSAFDVGYPKDIVRWSDAEGLEREVVQRLGTLYESRKYIRTTGEARGYFAGAALRKEVVFLSYSGADRDVVSGLAAALRSRFQQVFDYRDQGESIAPGSRWIEEIFDKLSASAIGIPVLSSTYFQSGNCAHEAREMVGQFDAGKLKLFPVKLGTEKLESPSWLKDVQYLRHSEYPSPEALVDKIVSTYDGV